MGRQIPIPNWDCSGAGPSHHPGEVRILPHTSDPHHGNDILCRYCYAKEMRFRRGRNKDLPAELRYALPAWSTLEVYRAGAPGEWGDLYDHIADLSWLGTPERECAWISSMIQAKLFGASWQTAFMDVSGGDHEK